MRTCYLVEWMWKDEYGWCRTGNRSFDTEQEQRHFAFEMFHKEEVFEVRQTTETVWVKP